MKQLFKKSCTTVALQACALFLTVSGSVALAQVSALTLPSGPVTPTISFSSNAGSLPAVNGYSAYIEANFSGLPSGLSIVNGQTYLTWCVDDISQLDVAGSPIATENTQAFTLFNTYPPTGQNSTLPANAQTPVWSQINYLLNYVHSQAPGTFSVGDIQETIWYLLDGGFVTDNPYIPNFPAGGDAGTTALLAAANSPQALNFVPQPGQVVAVLLDTGDGLTNSGSIVQDLLIEVPVPNSTPKIALSKTANICKACAFQPVTYTYKVTNTGDETLYNISVTDDNATPGYTGDDFVVGTIANLAPGASKTFNETVYPAVTECGTVNWKPNVPIGRLIVQNVGGNIEVTYRQSVGIVSNTYGTSAITPGQQFSNLVNNNAAQFTFTNGNGAVVWNGVVDYISATKSATFGNGAVTYPAGYGTLGVSGGSGKLLQGKASDLLFASTTLTTDLNQSSAFYGFTKNSPSPLANYPSWDVVDGYTLLIDSSIFGKIGFGGVSIPAVQNSAQQICGASSKVTPVPCSGPDTNTATVTASTAPYDGGTVTATATATVNVVVGGTCNQPTPPQCNPQPIQKCNPQPWQCR